MSLERDISTLARVPLFSGMDHEALRLMAFAAETRAMRAGEFLFRRGEMGEGAFLVMSGSVSLVMVEQEDRGAQSVGPGTLIGEHALLAPVRRAQTATVLELSSILAISRVLFTRVLHEYPNNARAVRRVWARRLHDKLLKVKT
jgi:CRP-like cAMP-binding protein